MASKYTIPGRAGFDYQDSVALDLVVEMMEHPDRFRWIQVERDDAGCLDDVTALKGSGEFLYWQVKFSVDPETTGDSYTWKKLMEREKGERGLKDSLLMRWARSLSQVTQQGPVAEAALITNRRAAADLRGAFKNSDLVDFDKIQSADTKAEIRNQLRTKKAARAFLGSFHFKVDQPGLDVLEEAVKKRFGRLGGTDEGWLSLKDAMRTWARERNQPPPHGLITLEKARQAARWKTLRRMPQEFDVPSDYVVPSQVFHDAFMGKIQNSDQRCIVLTAPPGTGKSTYLSFVVGESRDRGIAVVRHHYFLSLSDRTGDRVFHRRVAESLMNDLREFYPEAIGESINTNPNPENLGEWLDQCGKHFASHNQWLVVIIDGLDHVARDKGRLDEVRDLFYRLLPPPEGVTIVIGTQPLEEPNVPKRLLDYAPRDSWEQLPCLDPSGVRLWVEKNRTAFGLATHSSAVDNAETAPSVADHPELVESEFEQKAREAAIRELAHAFWTVSHGHPLHLRYCANYLYENGRAITPSAVAGLPPCSSGDIERYYRDLFDSVIHERGKQILHLMAACRFDWPQEGILETLDLGGAQRAEFVQALKSVRHMTRPTSLGLTAFHSSLLYYIETHEDHEHYRDDSRRRALNWLRSPGASAYLKWSQEWLLLATLGDTNPLIAGPDRTWAIDSVVKRYPPNETLRILSRSCRAALDKGLVANYLKTALLRDYVDWLYEGHETAQETMFEAQLVILRDDPFLFPRLRHIMAYLSPTELVILAWDAAGRGDQPFVRDILDHFNERTGRPSSTFYSDDLRGPLLRVAALCKNIAPSVVVEYCHKQGNGDLASHFVDVYANELWRAKKVDALVTLLEATPVEWRPKAIMKAASLMGMEQRTRPLGKDQGERISDPFLAVWMQLTSADPVSMSLAFPTLTCRERELYRGPGAYEARKNSTVDELRETFACFLAHELAGQPEANTAWLGTISDHLYEGRFLRKLNEVSRDLAANIRKGISPGLGFVFERLKDFESPDTGRDRESWDLYLAVKRAAIQIGLDVLVMSQYLGARPEISPYEIELAFGSAFCDWAAWTDIYLPLRRPWLSKDAVLWLLLKMSSDMKDSVDTFSDRALSFAQMAVLASSHGLLDHAAEYLRLAADNLLGYGQHKDILLFEALDMVENCHDAGITESRGWLVRLAPAVARVSDFTDGDMTSYLAPRMAEILAKVDSQMLLRYYEWLLSEEQYYEADKTFETYLKKADLAFSSCKATASTALDSEAIAVLLKRASQGDQQAAEVLSSIETLLGSLPLPREESRPTIDHPSGAGHPDECGPELSDYPPDRFVDYLTELSRQRPSRRQFRGVESWAQHWAENRHPVEAFEALETALGQGIEYRVSDDLVKIALTYLGNDLAFDWLVRAQGRNNGWRKYWGDRTRAVARWETVKDRYPERWLEFLVRSMALEDELARAPYGREKIQRLIQYSISMGQLDMTKELGEVVTQFICELVSPITLPRPGWVPENV